MRPKACVHYRAPVASPDVPDGSSVFSVDRKAGPAREVQPCVGLSGTGVAATSSRLLTCAARAACHSHGVSRLTIRCLVSRDEERGGSVYRLARHE
jgi:hypothetical protein